MKYYSYVEPNEKDEPVTVTLSVRQILRQYVEYSEQRFNGCPDAIDCMWSFIAVHWAYESDRDGNPIGGQR